MTVALLPASQVSNSFSSTSFPSLVYIALELLFAEALELEQHMDLLSLENSTRSDIDRLEVGDHGCADESRRAGMLEICLLTQVVEDWGIEAE
jgi:hypothetical protein